jgi:purine-binding chemotaxis protein CheW
MIETAEDKDGVFLVTTFYMGKTLQGIDTMRVQEAIRIPSITRVHKSLDYVLGVINLRGKIVTVLDMGRKLGLPPAVITEDSRIIIVDREDEYVGLLVDAIADVIAVDRSQLMPPPSNVDRIQQRFFQGIFPAEDGLIAIMNVEEILSVEDL